MLFVESRTLREQVDGATRTLLLEKLQERGLTPLVRSSRLYLYEQALLGSNRAHDMESAVAARTEIEGDAPYVRGDLFCFEDYAHYLIFSEGAGALRAGIIHEPEAADPQDKLESFCRNVSDSLAEARGGAAAGGGSNGQGAGSPHAWEDDAAGVPESFSRFAAAQREGPLLATRGEMVEGWLKSSGMLEDTEARRALRRLNETSREGGHAYLSGDEREAVPEHLLGKFTEAGLIRREILVSCRKDGRALFRLPSPDALSVLSNAICNECGASIADEKADEIIVPTSLVATLLQDSSWLVTHLRAILSKQGVPDESVAARPSPGADGEAQLMLNVSGEPFLLLVRDGDWAASNARRALEDQGQAEDAHLVVVATGKIHEDARQRLREHARRRAHGGREQELIFVEGMDALAAELQPALDRVCVRALSEALWELDSTLGMNVGFMMAARFRMMRGAGALRGVAASAASAAAAGSLAEF